MATRDGLAQIWYADANGVVTGYTPTADNVASAIIDTYNEHFGTDINIWTPETKTLQVGGTVTNWSAYEKIELATILVKTSIGGVYIFGVIEDTTLKVKGITNEDKAFVAGSDGVIKGSAGNASQMVSSVFVPRLNSQGYNVNLSEIIDAIYAEGQTVENWNDYVLIEQ